MSFSSGLCVLSVAWQVIKWESQESKWALGSSRNIHPSAFWVISQWATYVYCLNLVLYNLYNKPLGHGPFKVSTFEKVFFLLNQSCQEYLQQLPFQKNSQEWKIDIEFSLIKQSSIVNGLDVLFSMFSASLSWLQCFSPTFILRHQFISLIGVIKVRAF